MPRPLPLLTAPALLVAVGLAAATTGHAASGTRSFEQAETTASFRCTTGLRSVVVDGAGSTIRVTGRCRSVTVNGANVHVKADVVDRISVNGTHSRVSYLRSGSGGRARVSTTAVGARVTRR